MQRQLHLLAVTAVLLGSTAAQFRSSCICPPVDEHPGIVVDGDSACAGHENIQEDDIKIENSGSYLETVGLSIHLSTIQKLESKFQPLPLYIVADTVYIDQSLDKLAQEIIIDARNVIVTANNHQTNFENWKIYAAEASIHESFAKSIDVIENPAKDENILSALYKLTDYMKRRMKSASPKTDVCNTLKQKSSVEDKFDPVFDWIKNEALKYNDTNLIWRSKLIYQFRGDILEGEIINREVLDKVQLENSAKELSATIDQKLKILTQNLQEKEFDSKTRDKIPTLLSFTHQLARVISSNKIVEHELDNLKIPLVSKFKTIEMMKLDIDDPFMENVQIFENVKSFWPKEYDFEDMKKLIQSIGGHKDQTHRNLKISWIGIVNDIEILFQFENLLFFLKLENRLDVLKFSRKIDIPDTENYKEKRIFIGRESVDNYITVNTLISIGSVPEDKFINGQFIQRFWPSDNRFPELSNLRVHDIEVLISGISTDFISTHMSMIPRTSIMHDINELGEYITYTNVPVTYPIKKDTLAAVPPFTAWYFNPDADLAKVLKTLDKIEVKVNFKMQGRPVPGLKDQILIDQDCSLFKYKPFEFADCKFGGEAPFYGIYDMVNVIHLYELNQLYQDAYEEQLAGVDAGVVSFIDTPLAYIPGECEDYITAIINVTKGYKLTADVLAPEVYLPPDLNGYIEMHFPLSKAEITENSILTDCDTGIATEKEKIKPLKGAIRLVMSLESVMDVDSGSIYLDVTNSIVEDLNFNVTIDLIGRPKLLQNIRQVFLDNFKLTDIASVDFKSSASLPQFIRPKRFVYQTVCAYCQKSPTDEGYLIVAFETESEHGVSINFPKDPVSLGLHHALPEGEYNAGIFLGGHLAFCDMYLNAFNSNNVSQSYIVQYSQSSDPMKPTERELFIKTEQDLCIDFGSNFIDGDDGILLLYQNTYRFHSATQGPQARMRIGGRNTDFPHVGRQLAPLLAGFQSSFDQCTGYNCTAWWSWMETSSCQLDDSMHCIVSDPTGLSYSAWNQATLAVHREVSSRIELLPESSSLSISALKFDPIVELEFSGEINLNDLAVRDDAEQRIKEGGLSTLSMPRMETTAFHQLAASTLTFAGGKKFNIEEVFTPGTFIIYGRLDKNIS